MFAKSLQGTIFPGHLIVAGNVSCIYSIETSGVAIICYNSKMIIDLNNNDIYHYA